MSLSNFLGIVKIQNLIKIIKFNGGIVNSFLRLMRTDDLKIGKLVGVDKNGNHYYENDNYFYGRNRWVIYSDKFGYDYDGSQISPEWYGWLHYKTDRLPTEDPSRPNYKWMGGPAENMTGTAEQYTPYSTTRRKIEPWVPPNAKK